MDCSMAVLLLAIALALVLQPSPSSAAATPIGLHNCPTKCGKVSVAYPFGLSAGCSLPGFKLTYDRAHHPPRLLLGDVAADIRVTMIHLHSATVDARIGAIVNRTSASTPSSPNVTVNWPFLGDGGRHNGPPFPFVLSYHQNKFIAVGCNIQAKLLAPNGGGGGLVTGCSSFCAVDGARNGIVWEPTEHGHCGRCSGNGCCQSKIPLHHPSYDVQLKALDEERGGDVAGDPGMRNLVLVGEQGWIEKVWCWTLGKKAAVPTNGSAPDLSMVPVVLSWVMNFTAPAQPGKADVNTSTCSAVKGRDVCKSVNSSCVDVNTPFHTGYICQCQKGFHGNPYLTNGCQDIDECAQSHKCYGECINMPGTYECRCPRGYHGNASMINGCVKSYAELSIWLGVGSGTTILVLAISTIVIIRKVKVLRKKKQRQRFFKQNRGQLLQQLVSQRADIAERMIIPLEEIEKATNNFDRSREIGGGGHGTVYKGILSSQHIVAIKKAKIVIQREINEFINEVAILSQVNHQNIVKLFGCCLETEVPLLVYEFIPNGTLYNRLHVDTSVSLSWRDRLRIAIETSRALAYLHSFVSMPVIHRDIKSPNILLDNNLTVKLSDFGASRYIPIDTELVHTAVQETVGYLDPMYNNTGHLTEKSDVYSFGVLLIELLTRKKPVSYRSSSGFGLASHFLSLLSEGNLDQILDPQVTKEGDGEVVDVCLLAAICVKFKAEERPPIRQVEITLESIQASKEYYSDASEDDRFSEGTL
ncbi:hypothetical protein ACP4OV_027260 [Aristida adscensionis]